LNIPKQEKVNGDHVESFRHSTVGSPIGWYPSKQDAILILPILLVPLSNKPYGNGGSGGHAEINIHMHMKYVQGVYQNGMVA
jgi:hypothetical protein